MSYTPSADDQAKADALDMIDVVYEVTAKFVVTAGTFSGIASKETLAALISEGAGISADNIENISIIEVQYDNQVIAQAEGVVL